MTSERAQAYGHVVRTLEELGPTKLQPAEVDEIREAADTLLFSEQPQPDTLRALRDLLDRLVEAERWSPERASTLYEDLAACGPLSLVG